MYRHQILYLCTPRSTSLSKATAFNRKTVGEFFTNLKVRIAKQKIKPQSIFNIDETGITTVHVLGIEISEERGTLVTVYCAVSAIQRVSSYIAANVVT